MDVASRIPILGRNPVFVLEARRLWARAGLPIFVLIFLVVPTLFGLLIWHNRAIDAGWLPEGGLLRPIIGRGLAPGLFVSDWLLHDLASTGEMYIGGCMLAGWALTALWLPSVMVVSAAEPRERGPLEDMIVAGVSASTILRGRMLVAPVPLALLAVPVVLWAPGSSAPASTSWALAGMCVACSLGAPLAVGAVCMAFSTVVRSRPIALGIAYLAAWPIVLAPWALLLAADETSLWWAHTANMALLTAIFYACVASAAYTLAHRALTRLGASP